MKALSVRGDYIMDMIAGKKKIEYRTWKTNYRGPILMCSTAKKVAGAAPGYAICVVNLKSIQYFPLEGFYHWNIELANVIKPIHVKGQLKLFNVDDNLIEPISMKEFESEVRSLIYTPRRKKN
ncbi:ASCH domain-containing protein [Lactobacillus amylovorus]|uniref:ASCH domain-containing protein n=1 Tax=Lactobacillus amylovorus TaxID=1604 RepID=UPI00224402CD|nr:ASCH domain-containing protein [Lactobacillus amylovorus]